MKSFIIFALFLTTSVCKVVGQGYDSSSIRGRKTINKQLRTLKHNNTESKAKSNGTKGKSKTAASDCVTTVETSKAKSSKVSKAKSKSKSSDDVRDRRRHVRRNLNHGSSTNVAKTSKSSKKATAKSKSKTSKTKSSKNTAVRCPPTPTPPAREPNLPDQHSNSTQQTLSNDFSLGGCFEGDCCWVHTQTVTCDQETLYEEDEDVPKTVNGIVQVKVTTTYTSEECYGAETRTKIEERDYCENWCDPDNQCAADGASSSSSSSPGTNSEDGSRMRRRGVRRLRS